MDELAERAGLTKGAISLYEKGERVPLITNVYDIAKALGVSISYLTGEDITVDNKVDIINSILDKLGIESAFLNAHSMTENEIFRLEEDFKLAIKIVTEKHMKK